MAQSPIEQAKLIEGMQKDLADAESSYSSSEMGRGVVEAPGASDKRSFRPKAIRIKGKVIAQKELAEAHKAMDEAIQYLTENQNFKNQSERNAFKHELTKKMNQFQLDMLRQGAQAEFEFKKRGLEQAESEGMIQMLSDAVSGATMAAIGFSKKKQTLGVDPSQTQFGGGGYQIKNDPSGLIDTSQPVSVVGQGYGNVTPSPTPNISTIGQRRVFEESMRNATGTQRPSFWERLKGGG